MKIILTDIEVAQILREHFSLPLKTQIELEIRMVETPPKETPFEPDDDIDHGFI